MTEEWRDIEGWEGLYQISNLGRVYSCANRNYKKLTIRKTGYVVVSLICRSKNMRKQYKVHRLVAQAFIPNPNNLPCINHKDENKENNRVDNLEWCTNKYNSNYGHCREKISKALMGNKNGIVNSEEKWKNHSEAAKLLWQNPEYRKKVSLALSGENNRMYGKHHSEETKAKLRAAAIGRPNPMQGKKHSEETKRKISESQKRRLAKNKSVEPLF